jgi:anti-sigma regulatory factor (Ser/Thr protein kinase)
VPADDQAFPPFPDPAPEPNGSGAYSLEVPADPAYVVTARLFAGTVARRLGASEAAIDDLKLAVSEACTGPMRAGGSEPPLPVRLRLRPVGGNLAVEVSADGIRVPWSDAVSGGELIGSGGITPTDELLSSLGLQLILGLFEDAVVEESEAGGTNVRFTLPLANDMPDLRAEPSADEP